MIYGYRCRKCGHAESSTTRADTLGPCRARIVTYFDGKRQESSSCEAVNGGMLTRDFSGIGFGPVPTTSYNKTLNRPVSSGKGFDEALKRESEIASLRTGMEHRFERVDPTDKAALGVTDEGMDSTNRQRHKLGLPTR